MVYLIVMDSSGVWSAILVTTIYKATFEMDTRYVSFWQQNRTGRIFYVRYTTKNTHLFN